MKASRSPLIRTLAPGQVTRVLIYDTATGDSTLVHEDTDVLLEAPNWTADGDALLLNGDGVLWRLDLETRALTEVPFEDLPELNNDHVLAPGDRIFMSANDRHIYEGAIAGGSVRRVTNDNPGRRHYLHGVSPDGTILAYIGLEVLAEGQKEINIFTLNLSDGSEQQLTFGSAPADGSEYSPDGKWIYFNTEQFSTEPGHAQLARIPAGGGEPTQLTFDDRVNWFPHISPDGAQLVYLSYEPGTLGHPADRTVELRLGPTGDLAAAETIATLPGGQGTINVHSWAPDSRRFAYVEYPFAPESTGGTDPSIERKDE